VWGHGQGPRRRSPHDPTHVMKVLGLDPGSRKLGFGCIERAGSQWRRATSGTLVLRASDPLPARLHAAHAAVSEMIRTLSPDLVVVEECFVALGPRAALVLGQVRGVLILAVQQAALPLCEVAPRAVKLATVGNGAAAKEQVQYMMPRLLLDCPLKLAPDEADALAVAWCGATRTSAGVAS
jgi:crossover junction endodeoxyribonuclease RuvC